MCAALANASCGVEKQAWRRARCSHVSTRHVTCPRLVRSRVASVERSSDTVASGDLSSTVSALDRSFADSAEFSWTDQWYPAAAVQDLRADRPHAVTILGKRLALWRDGAGDWRALEDQCPHRAVALSEGRLERGNLQCAYHGWEFNGAGACVRIPQLYSGAREAQACASSRSRAAAYAVSETNGLLWVWMTPGADAMLRAAQTPVPCTAGADADWFVREVPYSWEVLAENVSDPSHVPFSHHGVLGKRDAPPKTEFTRVATLGAGGYEVTGPWTRRDDTGAVFRQLIHVPQVPTTHDIGGQRCANPDDPEDQWRPAEGAGFAICVRMAPVTRTTSRIFAANRIPPPTPPAAGAPRVPLRMRAMRLLFRVMPRWYRHLNSLAVLDGDGVFLHRQSQALAAGECSTRDYYLPASADMAVQALYTFLRARAPGGVQYHGAAARAGDAQGASTRESVLDRYHQHTAQCSSCSNALRNARLGMRALQSAGAVAAVAAVVLAALHARGGGSANADAAACAAAAGVAAGGWRVLRGLEKRLTFTDYVHAER